MIANVNKASTNRDLDNCINKNNNDDHDNNNNNNDN